MQLLYRMEITQIIILVVLLYALYVICNVENKKKVEEGFGEVNGNANYVVYGNVGVKNLPNGKKELSNGKIYDRNDSFDYETTVLSQGKNDVVYYNDILNQNLINEDATNIEYGNDVVDYSNVRTGLEKCQKNCDGICTSYGYSENAAVCQAQNFNQTFDMGVLLKNPAFTLGISDNN